MTLLSSLTFQRAYSLAKYHHYKQFMHRFLNLFFLRPRWIFFRLFLNRKSEGLILSTQIPTVRVDDYPEGIIPFLKVPPKLDSHLFPPQDKCDLLVEFEFHTHKHLLHDQTTERAWAEILQWIQSHSPDHIWHFFPAWHPYVVSKRIQTWIALWLIAPPQSEFQPVILKSLWEQGLWLNSSFEKDIGGNHLWENAQSLTLLSLFLRCPQSPSWLDRGLSLLKTVLSSQVSSHGEHFEKSPSYHWELTQGLEFLLPWVRLQRSEDYAWIRNYHSKMVLFASQIAHSNGILPLFNDSWETKVNPVSELYSSWIGDYFVSRKNDSFFIFDIGNMGPDELPAHSHCDLLTFELSLKKKVIIPNSGTFTYQGAERNVYRGTRAHNVIQVNEQNSSDIWNAFRMGRRGHVLNRGSQDTDTGTWVWGIHDGYKWTGIPKVLRLWFVANNLPLFCSFYFLKVDQPPQKVDEFIHFSPETVLSQVKNPEGPAQILIQQHSITLGSFQILAPNKHLTIEDTEYSPKFYERQPNSTLKLSQFNMTSHPALQLATAWALQSGADPLKIALDFSHPKIKLHIDTERKSFKTEFTIPHL